MQNIELSIIIPVYNVETYLDRCLQSLLIQNNQSYEIILIDDGSTDQSGIICDKYAQNDDRIMVIHQPNQGVSAARNAGLKKYRGRYLTFIDPDDFIAPNTYTPNMLLLKQNSDIDILQYPICRYYSSTKNDVTILPPQKISGKADIFLNWWAGFPLHFSNCNKIFKKEIFDGITFMEGHVSEDTSLIIDFYKRANTIYISNQGRYFYQVREDSYTYSYSFGKHMDLFNAHYKIYQEFHKYPQFISEKVIAFTRMYRRLIQAKQENPHENISPAHELLKNSFPTYSEILYSKNTEKLWLFLAKLIGCEQFTNLFIMYLNYKDRK